MLVETQHFASLPRAFRKRIHNIHQHNCLINGAGVWCLIIKKGNHFFNHRLLYMFGMSKSLGLLFIPGFPGNIITKKRESNFPFVTDHFAGVCCFTFRNVKTPGTVYYYLVFKYDLPANMVIGRDLKNSHNIFQAHQNKRASNQVGAGRDRENSHRRIVRGLHANCRQHQQQVRVWHFATS